MSDKEYKISIRTGSYGKFSMYAFEHAPTIGLKYLEISPMEPTLLKDMQEELGFKIGSFQFPINTSEPGTRPPPRTLLNSLFCVIILLS